MHILSTLLIARAFAAADGAYPVQAFRAAGLTKIEISGVRGRVRLTGVTGDQYRLRVSHSQSKLGADWGLSVERRGSTLVLEVYNVAYGPGWKRLLARDQWPKFDIDLSGPARPAVIGWRDGTVDVVNWRADVDASIVDGNVTVNGGAGRVNLQAARGDVAVSDFNGNLNVRGEDGALALTHTRGRHQLNWFAGRARLFDVRGRLSLDSQRARVSGGALDGRFDLRVAEGDVNLSGVAGEVNGAGRTAAWRIAPAPRAVVRVRRGRGSLILTPPSPDPRGERRLAGVGHGPARPGRAAARFID